MHYPPAPPFPQSPKIALLEKAGHPSKEVIPTVILDGIWGWHSRWEPLRRAIEIKVGPGQIWPYDSSGRVSIATLGSRLAADLQKLRQPFSAVGYSMGGLIIREALRQAPDLQLRRAVLLNSPHRGSLAAHLLPLAACRDMRPGSAFLHRLNAAPWPYPTLVSWCPGDLVVVPGHSARWARATRVLRCKLPLHEWPVVSPGIRGATISFLAGEEDQSSTTCCPSWMASITSAGASAFFRRSVT